MKVFVAEVSPDDYEPSYFVGVYSTMQLAESAIAAWILREKWGPYRHPDKTNIIIETELDSDG